VLNRRWCFSVTGPFAAELFLLLGSETGEPVIGSDAEVTVAPSRTRRVVFFG